MTEAEEMRKYAEAHGFDVGNDEYTAPRPLPCVRDENGSRKEWRVRDVMAKIDEERREFDAEIFSVFGIDTLCGGCGSMSSELRRRILDEWADMQIANTSAVAAILDASEEEMDEAIRRVNEKNRERGRL